jgi:protein tyrosine/serine phosphatase
MSNPPPPQELSSGPWDVPLDSFRRRIAAYASMIFVDHAFFRYIYLNLKPVTRNVWRSAQPTPHQIATLAKRGFKTIVTARWGAAYGTMPLEREACRRNGLIHLQFGMSSRDLPTREALEELPAFFARLQKPVLFHCKSGADRAGIISALYLIMAEGRPVAEAKQQLHWRYGHFRFAKTGVLDAFFDTYEEEGEKRGIPFMDWVRSGYDRERIKAGFKDHWLHALITEGVLRRE